MSADTDHVVLDYLDQVADEAQRRRMHPIERTEFIADLRRRIDRERERHRDEPDVVRGILAKLGDPADEVTKAMAAPRVATPRPVVVPSTADAGSPALAAPPITARRDRLLAARRRSELGPVVTMAIAVLVVILLVRWLGWFGYAIAWLFAWSLPPNSYGVRVVALLWLPAALLIVMALLGALTDWDFVMQRVFPLTAGLLGAGYLVWGSSRHGT